MLSRETISPILSRMPKGTILKIVGNNVYVDAYKNRNNGWYAFRILEKERRITHCLFEDEPLYLTHKDAINIGVGVIKFFKLLENRGLLKRILFHKS